MQRLSIIKPYYTIQHEKQWQCRFQFTYNWYYKAALHFVCKEGGAMSKEAEPRSTPTCYVIATDSLKVFTSWSKFIWKVCFGELFWTPKNDLRFGLI